MTLKSPMKSRMKSHRRTHFSTTLFTLAAVFAITLSACRSVPEGEFFDDAIAIYASQAEVQALDGGALGAVPVGFAFAIDMEVLPMPATSALPAKPATSSPANITATTASTASISTPVYVRSKAGIQGWVSRGALPQRLQRAAAPS